MNHTESCSRDILQDRANYTELVIVCCHAIWLGGPTHGAKETEWVIESFQKGETPTFVKHIEAGVELLKKHSRALLVFSGAATKQKITPLTEGESYLRLAKSLYPTDNLLRERMFAESFATDSYQNVLFSILKFRSITNHYPAHLHIVTHMFKRRRFLELHLLAIRWNSENTSFIGIDPPEDITPRTSLLNGERERGWGAWKRDLYGTRTETDGMGALSLKRIARGWRNAPEFGESVSQNDHELLARENGTREVENAYLPGAKNLRMKPPTDNDSKVNDDGVRGLLRFRGLQGFHNDGEWPRAQELYTATLPWHDQCGRPGHDQDRKILYDEDLDTVFPE